MCLPMSQLWFGFYGSHNKTRSTWLRRDTLYAQSPLRSIGSHLHLIHHRLLSTSVSHLAIPPSCEMIFPVLALHPAVLHPPPPFSSLSPSDLHPLSVPSPSSLSGLCRHISPPHLVSFPLTLEQMAGPCSLCVSLTDRGWSSTSIDDQSYAAPLRLSSP